jgi:hypothetical protein
MKWLRLVSHYLSGALCIALIATWLNGCGSPPPPHGEEYSASPDLLNYHRLALLPADLPSTVQGRKQDEKTSSRIADALTGKMQDADIVFIPEFVDAIYALGRDFEDLDGKERAQIARRFSVDAVILYEFRRATYESFGKHPQTLSYGFQLVLRILDCESSRLVASGSTELYAAGTPQSTPVRALAQKVMAGMLSEARASSHSESDK